MYLKPIRMYWAQEIGKYPRNTKLYHLDAYSSLNCLLSDRSSLPECVNILWPPQAVIFNFLEVVDTLSLQKILIGIYF